MSNEVKPPIEFVSDCSPKLDSFWRCGTCFQQCPTKETAIACCAPKLCADCSTPVHKTPFFIARCALCKYRSDYARTKALFDKAIKVTPDEYTGEMICLEGDDTYFHSYEDMLDHYESRDQAPPDYVWGTDEMSLARFDVDALLESQLEEHHEEAYEHLVDIEGLQTFLDAWVAKQTIKSYMVNTSVAVITKPEDRVYPTQVIVEAIDIEGVIHVKVPAWNPGVSLERDDSDFTREIQPLLTPGCTFTAYVNLGAINADAVKFYQCKMDEAVEGMLK